MKDRKREVYIDICHFCQYWIIDFDIDILIN